MLYTQPHIKDSCATLKWLLAQINVTVEVFLSLISHVVSGRTMETFASIERRSPRLVVSPIAVISKSQNRYDPHRSHHDKAIPLHRHYDTVCTFRLKLDTGEFDRWELFLAAYVQPVLYVLLFVRPLFKRLSSLFISRLTFSGEIMWYWFHKCENGLCLRCVAYRALVCFSPLTPHQNSLERTHVNY